MKDLIPSVALVRGLQKAREDMGLNGRDFSAKMGMSHTVWVRMCQAAEAGDIDKLNNQIGKKVIFGIRRNGTKEVIHLLDTYLKHEPDQSDHEAPLLAAS